MNSHGILPPNVFCHRQEIELDLESPHFPMSSALCCECKIGKNDGHGKVMDKYFVKYVGTLNLLNASILN